MIFGASRPRRPRSPSRFSRGAPESSGATADLPPKLVPSLRQFAATAASIAHTRLSLASLELEEEMHRLISAAVFGLIALILVGLALVVATFTIVAAAPIEYRVPTMIGITVIYLAIALILGLRVKSIFTNRPPIFGATLAELEKDKDALAQMARAPVDEEGIAAGYAASRSRPGFSTAAAEGGR